MTKHKPGPKFRGGDDAKRAFGRKLTLWMHTNQHPDNRRRSSNPTSWAQLAARINERVEADGSMVEGRCSNTAVLGWARGDTYPSGAYHRAFEYVTGIPWDVWANPKARLPERGSDYERGCFAFTRGSASERERVLRDCALDKPRPPVGWEPDFSTGTHEHPDRSKRATLACYVGRSTGFNDPASRPLHPGQERVEGCQPEGDPTVRDRVAEREEGAKYDAPDGGP